MKNEKFTKGKWKQRQNFEHALCTKIENGSECYHNEINIHDTDGRIICSVNYATDTPNMGWGRNETIDKWKANAQLIASAPIMLSALERVEYYLTALYESNETAPFPLRSELDNIREAIEKATKID